MCLQVVQRRSGKNDLNSFSDGRENSLENILQLSGESEFV